MVKAIKKIPSTAIKPCLLPRRMGAGLVSVAIGRSSIWPPLPQASSDVDLGLSITTQHYSSNAPSRSSADVRHRTPLAFKYRSGPKACCPLSLLPPLRHYTLCPRAQLSIGLAPNPHISCYKALSSSDTLNSPNPHSRLTSSCADSRYSTLPATFASHSVAHCLVSDAAPKMVSNALVESSSKLSAAEVEALLAEKKNLILGIETPELAPGSSIFCDEVPDYYAAGGLLACLVPIFVPALDGHASGASGLAETCSAHAPPTEVCSAHFPGSCPLEAPCGQAAAKLPQPEARSVRPIKDLATWTQSYACEAQKRFQMEQRSKLLYEEEAAAEEAAQEEVWQAILVEMQALEGHNKKKGSHEKTQLRGCPPRTSASTSGGSPPAARQPAKKGKRQNWHRK